MYGWMDIDDDVYSREGREKERKKCKNVFTFPLLIHFDCVTRLCETFYLWLIILLFPSICWRCLQLGSCETLASKSRNNCGFFVDSNIIFKGFSTFSISFWSKKLRHKRSVDQVNVTFWVHPLRAGSWLQCIQPLYARLMRPNKVETCHVLSYSCNEELFTWRNIF